VIVKKGAIRTIIAKVKIPRTKIKMGWRSQGPRWNADSGVPAKTSSPEYQGARKVIYFYTKG
jgi:hypothetical protein